MLKKIRNLAGRTMPIDGKLRYKLSVFLICTLISSLMWGMIKLTHDYEITLKYNVRASALPKGKILVSNADSVISVTIKARGLEFYSRLISQKDPVINFDLSALRLKREGDTYSAYLRTSASSRIILEQLPVGVELISVYPDTLHFLFEKSYSKKVAVVSNVSVSFTRPFYLYDSISTSPDSIKVTGRKSVIDTLRQIKTEYQTFSGIKENISEMTALLKPDVFPPLQFSKDSVRLNLVVEKFTEAIVEVPVSLFSGDERVGAYNTFPEKVKVTCLVAMKDYNRLDPSQFRVISNVDQARSSGERRIPVSVSVYPHFVKVLKIEPEKIEYLIIK